MPQSGIARSRVNIFNFFFLQNLHTVLHLESLFMEKNYFSAQECLQDLVLGWSFSTDPQ